MIVWGRLDFGFAVWVVIGCGKKTSQPATENYEEN